MHDSNHTNPLPLIQRILTERDQAISRNTNIRTAALYLRQIKRAPKSIISAIILIPISAICIDSALPYVFAQTIASITESDSDAVTRWILIGAGIGLLGVALNNVGFRLLVHHETKVRAWLGYATFKDLINKDYDFFSNQKIGALTTRYIDFVRAQVVLQDLIVIRTLTFLVSLAFGLTIVSIEAPLLGLCLGVMIILLLASIRLGLKMRQPFRMKRKKKIGEYFGAVADAITNNLIVKTFANEDYEQRIIKKELDELAPLYAKDAQMFVNEGSVRIAFMIFVQLSVISLVSYLVLQGDVTLVIAIFTLTYLQRISAQLFTLGDLINGYDQAFLDAAPMTDIIDSHNYINDTSDATDLQVNRGEIAFKDVFYKYSDANADALQQFNLVIKPGEKIGIVGHSGAGKTTLTRLLLRFDNVTDGSILIDNQNINDVAQHSLRQAISYVPQEAMLFHRSLRENISYGKIDATDDEIIAAAKKAHAWEFIKDLDKQLDTIVGERGVKLSGGQRQRIAIARAILKDAPILMLDEATSALDSSSEKLIQSALRVAMEGRTTLVIAHRLSTIREMDRIVVMEHGTIIENGSHDELLAKDRLYAELWQHQSGGFIEE